MWASDGCDRVAGAPCRARAPACGASRAGACRHSARLARRSRCRGAACWASTRRAGMLFAASSPIYRRALFFLGSPTRVRGKSPICGRVAAGIGVAPWGMTVMQLAARLLHPSPSPPRTQIRARLDAGTLPPVSSRTWVRRARGRHRCACCGRRIRASVAECEVSGPVKQPYAHMQCFRVWAEESHRSAPDSQGRATSPSAPMARRALAELPADSRSD
jgi:hypothetical protein